jgi:hypothetical protein
MDTDKYGHFVPCFFDDRSDLHVVRVSAVLHKRLYSVLLTSPKVVLSILPLTIRAATSLFGWSRQVVMMGVVISATALMTSLIRGTPMVTFIEATPAKWNVFRVICVPGSPIDCPATAPTVEPIDGSILDQLRNAEER